MVDFEALVRQCLELPESEREKLMDLLYASFTDELSAEELALIRQRSLDAKAGRLECVPAEIVIQEMEKRLPQKNVSH